MFRNRVFVAGDAIVLDAMPQRCSLNLVRGVAVGTQGGRLALGNTLQAMHVARVGLEDFFVAIGTGNVGDGLDNFDVDLGMRVVAVGAGGSLFTTRFHQVGVHAVFEFCSLLFVAGGAGILVRQTVVTFAFHWHFNLAVVLAVDVLMAIGATGFAMPRGQECLRGNAHRQGLARLRLLGLDRGGIMAFLAGLVFCRQRGFVGVRRLA